MWPHKAVFFAAMGGGGWFHPDGAITEPEQIAGGVLVLSLGCENNNLDVFTPFLKDFDPKRGRVRTWLAIRMRSRAIDQSAWLAYMPEPSPCSRIVLRSGHAIAAPSASGTSAHDELSAQ